MQKILITLYKEYWERKNNNFHNLSLLCEQREHNSKWGLGLAPTRQTQKEQYACPDVTSPNRLHPDPDMGKCFLGNKKEKKRNKRKERIHIYIISYIILLYYIVYYCLLRKFVTKFCNIKRIYKQEVCHKIL